MEMYETGSVELLFTHLGWSLTVNGQGVDILPLSGLGIQALQSSNGATLVLQTESSGRVSVRWYDRIEWLTTMPKQTYPSWRAVLSSDGKITYADGTVPCKLIVSYG